MKTEQPKIRMTKEQRRKQILDAAMTVFIEKGYNGTTTLEIAQKANIAEVTLFRHFPSKKELFLAGIEPIMVATLVETIDSSKSFTKAERLEFILTERLQFISQNYQIVKLILMESQVNPELYEFNFVEKISGLLKTSIQQTGVRSEDEEVALRILMGAILSFLFMPVAEEDQVKKLVNQIISTIIKD